MPGYCLHERFSWCNGSHLPKDEPLMDTEDGNCCIISLSLGQEGFWVDKLPLTKLTKLTKLRDFSYFGSAVSSQRIGETLGLQFVRKLKHDFPSVNLRSNSPNSGLRAALRIGGATVPAETQRKPGWVGDGSDLWKDVHWCPWVYNSTRVIPRLASSKLWTWFFLGLSFLVWCAS